MNWFGLLFVATPQHMTILSPSSGLDSDLHGQSFDAHSCSEACPNMSVPCSSNDCSWGLNVSDSQYTVLATDNWVNVSTCIQQCFDTPNCNYAHSVNTQCDQQKCFSTHVTPVLVDGAVLTTRSECSFVQASTTTYTDLSSASKLIDAGFNLDGISHIQPPTTGWNYWNGGVETVPGYQSGAWDYESEAWWDPNSPTAVTLFLGGYNVGHVDVTLSAGTYSVIMGCSTVDRQTGVSYEDSPVDVLLMEQSYSRLTILTTVNCNKG